MKKFALSFVFALRGVALASKGRNMRVHVAATVVCLLFCAAYAVSGLHLALVMLSISVVLALEAVNTAFEMLCDLVARIGNLDFPNEEIRNIKDLAAGAVLFVAIGAGSVGALVFLPYFSY